MVIKYNQHKNLNEIKIDCAKVDGWQVVLNIVFHFIDDAGFPFHILMCGAVIFIKTHSDVIEDVSMLNTLT